MFSANAPDNWNPSSVTPIAGGKSAFWSRSKGDAPTYTRVLPAPIDLTGRSKFTFWLGLATTSSAYKNWHKGAGAAAGHAHRPGGRPVTVRRQARAGAGVSAADKTALAEPVRAPSRRRCPTSITRTSPPTRCRCGTRRTATRSSRCCRRPRISARSPDTGRTGTPLTRGAFYTLPGVMGPARAPMSIGRARPVRVFTVVDFITAGVHNWTCPAGVTKVDKRSARPPGVAARAGTRAGRVAGAAAVSMRPTWTSRSPLGHSTIRWSGGWHGGHRGPGSAHRRTGGGDTWAIGDSLTTYAHGGIAAGAPGLWGGGKGGYGVQLLPALPGRRRVALQLGPGSDGRRGGGGGARAGRAGGTDGGDSNAAPRRSLGVGPGGPAGG